MACLNEIVKRNFYSEQRNWPLISLHNDTDSHVANMLFVMRIYPIQSSRATNARELLNEVGDMNIRCVRNK